MGAGFFARMFFSTRILDHRATFVNTVHMNKSTLKESPLLCSMISFYRRSLCFLRGRKWDPHPSPQWQQLELPFTRTPVKRWNR